MHTLPSIISSSPTPRGEAPIGPQLYLYVFVSSSVLRSLWVLNTALLSAFMPTEFCQGHRGQTVATLTVSKLKEWQPLHESPSAALSLPLSLL